MTDDELKRLFEATRQESAAMHVETRRHFDEKAAETQRHFDVVAERLEKRFDLLVETVGRLDEKIDRETRGIRDEMQRGFADTQAMIKFSHAELDRRVGRLEESVADLQSRVERLESSTH